MEGAGSGSVVGRIAAGGLRVIGTTALLVYAFARRIRGLWWRSATEASSSQEQAAARPRGGTLTQ